MPSMFKQIPVRVQLQGTKFPEESKNFQILEVETIDKLKDLEPAHPYSMFIKLVYMRGQGIKLKDTGRSNWVSRILLDAAFCAPHPGTRTLKNFDDVSGFRDILSKHSSTKEVVQAILQKS